MKTLEERIASLEAEIAGYVAERNRSNDKVERKELLHTITVSRNVLKNLLDQQSAGTTGVMALPAPAPAASAAQPAPVLTATRTAGQKRTTHDIGNLDQNSSRYWRHLVAVLPPSGAALKLHLNSQLVVPKIALYQNHVQTLQMQLGFDDLLEQVCNYADDSMACASVSESLMSLSTMAVSVVNDSENSMIAYMDVIMRIFEVFINQPRRRNVCNKTSGQFKPDNMLCDGARGDVYAVGEEKLKSAYQPGVVGKDPAAENLHKTRFNDWRRCYGDLPYIFAYDALGSTGRVDFNFGVLDRDTRSFVKLYSGNLADYGNRAEFALVLLKLLPVLKAVIAGAAPAVTPLFHPLMSWDDQRAVRKVVTMIHSGGSSGDIWVEKKWEWMARDVDTGRAAIEAQQFCARLRSVFTVLDAVPCEHEGFSLFKATKSNNTDLSIHSSGIITNAAGVAAAANGDAPIGVKGFFTPMAQSLRVDQGRSYVQFVLNLARCVALLHSLNIVHNDIRIQNIGMSEDGRVILFDFDDAYVLTEPPYLCPALTHLGLGEHPARSHEQHGKEVDVWAIGHILARFPVGQRLGSRIQAEFLTLSIDNVVESLEQMLNTMEA